MIEDLWYKNTVIYSLDLETFLDANGDGTGDFVGLTRGLDHLHSLGVETLWLAPFQPSPNRDNGYDISDFYGVDPRHGSSGDFVEFMHEANERGMRVIIDLVVNHTSDKHPWFQSARKDPQSKYRDWYIWSKKRPKDWNTGMVFPGVQKSTWTYDEEAREYYYHRFYDFQPDLNFDNPEVRAEVRRIIGYWLELGVAGFRVDAVPFVIESKNPGKKKSELKFDYLTELRSFMQWRCGDAILLGEANVLPGETREYFGARSDGIHMMFNFWVNQHLFYALASGDIGPLTTALKETQRIPGLAQWAHFLRNHDELDLGRLTEEQRETVFSKFAPEKEMQLYDRGIRMRLASMLGDPRLIELAYSLLFSLPGTPVLRYGDEIGMGDDLDLEERNAVRTPMQWTEGRHGGFSEADRTVQPVISTGPYAYQQLSVAAQKRDPNSLLNWTGRMIRLRKECPEIGWGTWRILRTGAPSVLAMRYEWQGNALVVLHNFSDKACAVSIRSEPEDEPRMTNLLAPEENTADEGGHHRISLEAHGYRWYRVGASGYLLRRRRR